MSEIINELNIAINDTTQMVVEISDLVSTLNSKQLNDNKTINEIKQALKLIDRVSSQTNILGLNAMIESAHVGENGKSFAIIANEVRKLADETKLHEVEINKMVEQIIKSSNETTAMLSRITDDIQQAAANLEEITATVENMT